MVRKYIIPISALCPVFRKKENCLLKPKGSVSLGSFKVHFMTEKRTEVPKSGSFPDGIMNRLVYKNFSAAVQYLVNSLF